MMLIFLAAASAAAAQTARAFVDRLYAQYSNENYSPFEHSERIFAPGLNAAIKEDERLAHGEVGFLDGDPICDCQDTGGMHSRVLSVAVTGGNATAHVLLKWEGEKDSRDIQLRLVRTAAGWRVADVGTSDEPSLLKDLEKANREARKH
jgi:Protein of unknown function (DUF3828)